jgi:CRP-like cAMP-binding protein
MTMGTVARSVARPSSTDALVDLDSRKRRIIARGILGHGTSPATQQAMLDAGSIHRVGKGRTLFPQGEAATTVALVGLGRLRLVRSSSDGRTLLLGYRGAGDILGEDAITGVTTHRESAIVMEDVDALVVPIETMKELFARDAGMATTLLSSLLERQTDTEERLASVLFRNVEARLAEFLVKASIRWGIPDPRGTLISAPFTHQEMASMIGSTRETVTLTLGDLRRKNVIEIDRRRVVVLDRDALRSRI